MFCPECWREVDTFYYGGIKRMVCRQCFERFYLKYDADMANPSPPSAPPPVTSEPEPPEQVPEKIRKNARRKSIKSRVRALTRQAINRGEIPPVTELPCAKMGDRCRGMAEEYHHLSYTLDDPLDVTPLCIPCHNDTHLDEGGDENFFGTVRERD